MSPVLKIINYRMAPRSYAGKNGKKRNSSCPFHKQEAAETASAFGWIALISTQTLNIICHGISLSHSSIHISPCMFSCLYIYWCSGFFSSTFNSENSLLQDHFHRLTNPFITVKKIRRYREIKAAIAGFYPFLFFFKCLIRYQVGQSPRNSHSSCCYQGLLRVLP